MRIAVLLLLLVVPTLAAADDGPKAESPKTEVPEPKATARSLQQKLLVRTDLEADKLPLKEVVKRLSEQCGVTIRLDEAELKKANVAPDAPVTASVKNLTLNRALAKILGELNLAHRIDADAG